MTDEERIARLTALAQKVWSDPEEQPVIVQQGLDGSDPHSAFVRTSGGVVLDVAAPNERALDAIEAALLVLGGDGSARHTFDSGRRFERAMREIVSDIKAHDAMHTIDRVRAYAEDPSLSDADARLYIAGALDGRVAR